MEEKKLKYFLPDLLLLLYIVIIRPGKSVQRAENCNHVMNFEFLLYISTFKSQIFNLTYAFSGIIRSVSFKVQVICLFLMSSLSNPT